ITDMPTDMAAGIWYAPDSDRIKASILRAAAVGGTDADWDREFPTAIKDVVWLVERVQSLTETRNNAIHAPVMLITRGIETGVGASPRSGHLRAKKLVGKEILVE